MAQDGSILFISAISHTSTMIHGPKASEYECGQLALLIEMRSPGPRSGQTPSEGRRIGQTCCPAAPAKLAMANCHIVRTAQGLTLHVLEGVRTCPYNFLMEF